MLTRHGAWTQLEMRLPESAYAPCGFDAGDANLRRVVGNAPTNATDPSGLSGININPGASALNLLMNPLHTYDKQGLFWVEFDPSKSRRVSAAKRIVFIQAIRCYIDGKPVKPSDW